jgi:hypothetical protein
VMRFGMMVNGALEGQALGHSHVARLYDRTCTRLASQHNL